MYIHRKVTKIYCLLSYRPVAHLTQVSRDTTCTYKYMYSVHAKQQV